MAVARAVAHVRECARFQLGDLMLYGVKLYGVQIAYDLARQATGLPEGTLRDALWCARVHTRAAQARVVLLSSPRDCKVSATARERILNEAIEIGLTTRQVRKIAEEEFGKAEKPKSARVNVTIHLWPETVERLKEMADGKQLTWFISRAIEDWLRSKGEGDCVPHPQTTAERRAEWEAEGLRNLCGTNPHLEGRKMCEHCRETRNLLDRLAAGRTNSGRYRRRHHGRTIVAASTN